MPIGKTIFLLGEEEFESIMEKTDKDQRK